MCGQFPWSAIIFRSSFVIFENSSGVKFEKFRSGSAEWDHFSLGTGGEMVSPAWFTLGIPLVISGKITDMNIKKYMRSGRRNRNQQVIAVHRAVFFLTRLRFTSEEGLIIKFVLLDW